ncbi:hypothetical protein D3C77_403360 [compost metagenome]
MLFDQVGQIKHRSDVDQFAQIRLGRDKIRVFPGSSHNGHLLAGITDRKLGIQDYPRLFGNDFTNTVLHFIPIRIRILREIRQCDDFTRLFCVGLL